MLRLALVDCNNFFVSCERVFSPKLKNKPVIVLSNNDGCIISRSNEVKALGIPMGAPLFKYQSEIRKHRIHLFSANFSLYMDMSNRVMETLSQIVPELEIYSIDEAFLHVDHIPNILTFAKKIKQTVEQWTGIPVSIGIAHTKTLAKAANEIAKKDPTHMGVFDIQAADHPDAVLSRIAVQNIWGIGRGYTQKLNVAGITNALALRNLPDPWVQKNMGLSGLRTVHELRGIPVITSSDVPEQRHSLIYSRSFAKPIRSVAEIKEALAAYVSAAAVRMRRENLKTGLLSVSLVASKSSPGKIWQSLAHSFSTPTAYTPRLIQHAHALLEKLHQPNVDYRKIGVTFLDLTDTNKSQLDFFSTEDKDTEIKQMKTVDAINSKWGSGTIRYGSIASSDALWMSKKTRRSPEFTTEWSDILTVRI